MLADVMSETAQGIRISTWSLADGAQSLSAEQQLQLLDARERQHLQALRRPELARRYLAAHAGLRQRLGPWLDTPPETLRITVTPAGKPWLPDHPNRHFSLSHSDDFAMLGLAAVPIGIDIEAIQKPAVLTPELTAEVLTTTESEYLRASPAADQAHVFTRFWVCKEAVMKASGLGCRLPPRCIALNLPKQEIENHASMHATLSSEWAERLGKHWRIALLRAPAGHVAAVAAAGDALPSIFLD